MRNIILLGIVFFAFAKINAQQLASYIQEAQDNNPEIQAFELRYNIAEEKVNEASNVPTKRVKKNETKKSNKKTVRTSDDSIDKGHTDSESETE